MSKEKTRQQRCLHLVGATGQLRVAQYEGRDHLVVPIVAMVEGVVWAVNSDKPEFVPAEELAETPQQWNGRRCFADHPADEEGEQVTANTPRTLEKSFGVIFETAGRKQILESRRLTFNAWLDPKRAAEIGEGPLSVIRRLRAGEVVEVSVGAFVDVEEADGEYDGKEYHGVWRDLVADHLAFIHEGGEGACSVAAGCGANRAASVRVRHLVTAEGIKREGVEMPEPVKPKKRSMLQRMRDLLGAGFRGAAMSESDADVRRMLSDALRAVEPGYMGIEAVYPDDLTVIYYVAPEDEYLCMRQSYTTSDGRVALGGDRVEVEPVLSYEEVKAAASALQPPTEPKAACGCQAGRQPTAATAAKETIVMRDNVKSLIEGSAGKYSEADAPTLEKLSDEQISTLSAKTPAAPVVPEAPKAAAAAPVLEGEEQFLGRNPALKALVDRQRASDKAAKDQLVAKLKTAQAAYTEAELNAMDVEQLTRLAAVAKVESVDFSGRGVQQVPAASDADYGKVPDAYEKGIKAMQAANA